MSGEGNSEKGKELKGEMAENENLENVKESNTDEESPKTDDDSSFTVSSPEPCSSTEKKEEVQIDSKTGEGTSEKSNELKRKFEEMSKDYNEAEDNMPLSQVFNLPVPVTLPKKEDPNFGLLEDIAHSILAKYYPSQPFNIIAPMPNQGNMALPPVQGLLPNMVDLNIQPSQPFNIIQPMPNQGNIALPPVQALLPNMVDLNAANMNPDLEWPPAPEVETIPHNLVRDMLILTIQTLESGTNQNKGTAARTLRQMALWDKRHMVTIGESNAIRCLINLLEERDLSVVKEACRAIDGICFSPKYRKKVIHSNAVAVLIANLQHEVSVDFIDTLRHISGDPEGAQEMINQGAVGLMLEIIKESRDTRLWEWCIEILDNISNDNDPEKRTETEREEIREIKMDECRQRTITKVREVGNVKGRRIAQSLLAKLNLPSQDSDDEYF